MLAERFSNYIHSVITFPGYPGFPEQPANFKSFPSFLSTVQDQNFDLAIQMHGSGIISNPLVEMFDANHLAGFYTHASYKPNEGYFIEYPHHLHEIERHLLLMEKIGITGASKDLEFPITKKDQEDFEKAAIPVQPGEYVIIHPGSRGVSRQWDKENFAATADYCYEKGLQIVITGTPDEMDIVTKVESLMKHKPIIAAGKTSLGAVAVLIKNAAALVSNCTGVSHIASALKTKSIVISLDGEPNRWAPLNKKLHRSIDWTTTPSMSYVKEEIDELLFKSMQLS
jgi:ADP-heptose:LPS heptosyltransferase